MKYIKFNISIFTCLLIIFSFSNSTFAEADQNLKAEQQHQDIFEELKFESENETNNLNNTNENFNSILEDDYSIQPAVLVLTMRDHFVIGSATLKKAGYIHTAKTMLHSAQKKPATLSFQKGTSMSNDIKKSSIFKSKLKSFKAKLPKSGSSYYSQNGSFSLTSSNSSKDLYLALHKVSYTMAAEKKKGVWTIYTRIHDKYDFQYWNKSQAPNAFVQLANNYGANAMKSGAINPYNINIYIVNTH